MRDLSGVAGLSAKLAWRRMIRRRPVCDRLQRRAHDRLQPRQD
jgi:hypothetical protein